jgi:DNA polymerase alpha subunit B
MCQMFNFPADKLFYKWEAFSYNSMSTLSLSTFNMDTALALKSQIQRELATEKARSVQTKQAPPGNVRGLDRKFLGTNLRKSDVVSVGGISGSTSGYIAKAEMMDVVAGPSTVTFKGPSSDPADKKRRACEINVSHIFRLIVRPLPARQIHVRKDVGT